MTNRYFHFFSLAFLVVAVVWSLLPSKELKEVETILESVPVVPLEIVKSNLASKDLDNLSQFFTFVDEQYVDSSRILPNSLLKAGLSALEKSSGEMEFFKADRDQVSESTKEPVLCFNPPPVHFCKNATNKFFSQNSWNLENEIILRVGERVMKFSMPKNVNTLRGWDEIAREMISEVSKNSSLSLSDAVKSFANGILEQLDPHSHFLSADEYRELRSGTRGNFGGVGVVLDEIALLPTIREIIPNSPAQLSGLKTDDVILKIGKSLAVFQPISNVLKNIRTVGSSETTPTWVYRPSSRRIFSTELFRDELATKSVEWRLVEGRPDILFLKISGFSSKTSEDLIGAYEEASKSRAKPFSYIILDLRGNPGGLLEQAVQTTDLFLEKGTILSTRSRSEEIVETVSSEAKIGDPLVILQNSSSASASEILAGALKDHHRALIVGERSFGKGSVQSVFELLGGSALKLTVAHYFTPKGASLQEKGVDPHVIVKLVQKKSDALWMSGSSEYDREENLSAHLLNPTSSSPEQSNLKSKMSKDNEIWSITKPETKLQSTLNDFNFSYPGFEHKDGIVNLDEDSVARVAVLSADAIFLNSGIGLNNIDVSEFDFLRPIRKQELDKVTQSFEENKIFPESNSFLRQLGSRFLHRVFGKKQFASEALSKQVLLSFDSSRWELVSRIADISKNSSQKLTCCEGEKYAFIVRRFGSQPPKGIVSMKLSGSRDEATFWVPIEWKQSTRDQLLWTGTIGLPKVFRTYLSLLGRQDFSPSDFAEPRFVEFSFLEGFGEEQFNLGMLSLQDMDFGPQGPEQSWKILAKMFQWKDKESQNVNLTVEFQLQRKVVDGLQLVRKSLLKIRIVPIVASELDGLIGEKEVVLKEISGSMYSGKLNLSIPKELLNTNSFGGIVGAVVVADSGEVLESYPIFSIEDGSIVPLTSQQKR